MQSCHNTHNLKLVRSRKSQFNLLGNFSKGVETEAMFLYCDNDGKLVICNKSHLFEKFTF